MKVNELMSLVGLEAGNLAEERFCPVILHQQCLHLLEIGIRLRRGLSVVTGEPGSGKSMICRQLLRNIRIDAGNTEILSCLIEDCEFATPRDFLLALCQGFDVKLSSPDLPVINIKETLKNFLFEQCISARRIVALLIDNGQKLSLECLEMIRELLNYETNEYKLLQTVIFARTQFNLALQEMPNLKDRIHLIYPLTGLKFSDTRKLLNEPFREVASKSVLLTRAKEPFTLPALIALYLSSKGLPAKIALLSKLARTKLFVEAEERVKFSLARKCIKELSQVDSWE